MGDTEPNGVPAASDAAGQQPTATPTTTTTTTDTSTSATTSAASDTTDTTPSESPENPQAKKYADEAANYRKQLRDAQRRIEEFEAKQKAADMEKLSEAERLRAQLADAQAKQAEQDRKHQERVIRAEVRAQAAQASIPPDLAARLIDYAEIEFDDEGEPQNIGKLLGKLAKDYPQLVQGQATRPQPTSVGVTAANPARGQGQSGAISAEYIQSLTDRQYAALPDARRQEILQWMAANPAALRKP